MHTFIIDGKDLTLEDLQKAWKGTSILELSEQAKETIRSSRSYLETVIQESEQPIYGVNTGFGSLCDVLIEEQDLDRLQQQLLVSHAAGIGSVIDESISKNMLLLKIIAFSKGFSGVRLELVNQMIELYNRDIIPVIYELGSLGASGDLAPLAHMSLPLIGEGKVHYNGQIVDSITALKAEELSPISLKAKEGLALLNGTQFSLSHGLDSLIKGKHLFESSIKIAALSCDAYNTKLAPFDPLIQQVRRHTGQAYVAQKILHYLEGSEILDLPKYNVQDPYSFRCIPQVLGTTKQVLDHVQEIFVNELNAVTDNPTIFKSSEKVLSGGNFHAQPLGLALEYLGMGLGELGNIAERRIYNLISGERALPAFLTSKPGVQSGFMIGQYTAAAILNQTKHLANPVTTDSIISCMGQEDHVSMAANAGTKTRKIVDNVASILAIELLCACQAFDFRLPTKPSPLNYTIYTAFREQISKTEEDRVLSEDMHKSVAFLWEELI